MTEFLILILVISIILLIEAIITFWFTLIKWKKIKKGYKNPKDLPKKEVEKENVQ